MPDAAGTVDVNLVEAAPLGLVGFLVPEVPLAEDAGGGDFPVATPSTADWKVR